MAGEGRGDEALEVRRLQLAHRMERIYKQQRRATRLFIVAIIVMCGGILWLLASVAMLLTGH